MRPFTLKTDLPFYAIATSFSVSCYFSFSMKTRGIAQMRIFSLSSTVGLSKTMVLAVFLIACALQFLNFSSADADAADFDCLGSLAQEDVF